MKNKIISIMFCLLIGGTMLLNIFTPDTVISFSERRPLAQKPEITNSLVFGGNMDTILETYALDQFVGRDDFKTIKSLFEFKVLNKLDNNNIYVLNDYIFKQEYPLNNSSVINMAKKIDKLYDLYLKNCNVLLGIIPDKSEYIAKDSGHLSIDYTELNSLLLSNLKAPIKNITDGSTNLTEGINYLDLKNLLSLDSYYRTDLHWRQEKLSNIVSSIGDIFGFSTNYDNNIPIGVIKDYSPFYGAYYGQASLKLPADTIRYVEDEFIKNAIVTDFDQAKKEPATSVYNTNKLGSVDSYDLFFSGNSPLITIENPLCATNKELIIFRDSFGSSLAPLLLEGYSKITLVDLRFIPTENLGMFVDFQDQDVLLLYSQGVINNSDMIK